MTLETAVKTMFVYQDFLWVLSKKGISTISSGPDNGFNNCAADKFQNSSRHDTTKKAIDNLVNKVSLISTKLEELEAEELAGKGLPWICGHGDEGFMTTGSAQDAPQTFDNTVGTYNEYKWGPEFERLKGKNYAILTLLTCDTGAGQEGADLLFSMAQRTGKPVRARTGLTYCGSGGITYQDGSTWQVATPESKPEPINLPFTFRSMSENLLLFQGDKFETVQFDDIANIQFTRAYKLLRDEVIPTSFELPREEAQAILGLIDFSNPFNPGGIPAALISGKLSISIAGKENDTREFNIYNDRLVQDLRYCDVFYNVAPGFRGILKELL